MLTSLFAWPPIRCLNSQNAEMSSQSRLDQPRLNSTNVKIGLLQEI